MIVTMIELAGKPDKPETAGASAQLTCCGAEVTLSLHTAGGASEHTASLRAIQELWGMARTLAIALDGLSVADVGLERPNGYLMMLTTFRR